MGNEVRKDMFRPALLAMAVVLMAIALPVFPGVTTVRIAFLVLVAVTVVYRSGTTSWRQVLFFLTILLFAAFIAVSGLVNGFYEEALATVFSILMLTLSAFLLAVNVKSLNKEGFAKFADLLSLAVLIVIGLVYTVMYFEGATYGYAARVWIDDTFPSGLSRLMNSFSILLVLSLVGCFVSHEKQSLNRKRFAAALMLFSFFVVVCGSRQSLILVPFMLIGLVFSGTGRHIVYIALSIVALCFVAQLWLGEGTEWVVERYSFASDPSESDSLRHMLWSAAVDNALNSPLVGGGPGAILYEYGHYPHNGLLGYAAAVGVMPAIVSLSLLFFVAAWLYHRSRKQVPKGLRRCLVGGGALVLSMSFFNDLLFDSVSFIYLGFFVGVMVSLELGRHCQLNEDGLQP